MYAVVGCSECSALWIVEGRPETSQCPTCGHTRQHAKRKKFVTTDDPDHAREVRAAMLAERRGQESEFASVDPVGALDDRIDEAGVDDETYLAGSGVDPDAVAEAGERAESGSGGRSNSRTDIVRRGLRDLDGPDERALVEYARERGVDPDATRRILEKLVRSGAVTESDGGYRLV